MVSLQKVIEIRRGQKPVVVDVLPYLCNVTSALLNTKNVSQTQPGPSGGGKTDGRSKKHGSLRFKINRVIVRSLSSWNNADFEAL